MGVLDTCKRSGIEHLKNCGQVTIGVKGLISTALEYQ